MLWLCEPVPAQKALEWGLVNQVVPRDRLDETTATMAGKLLEKMPEIIRYAKQQTNFWRDFAWSLTVGHARDWLSVHADTDETEEGLMAFYEKRPVNYTMLRERLAAGQVRCSNCGSAMPGKFAFFGNCGSKMEPSDG